MLALTRRRDPERHQECWQIYYADNQVGTIGERAGVPKSGHQWEWTAGLYPRSPDPKERSPGGTAATFEKARTAWEAAWRDYLPGCIEDTSPRTAGATMNQCADGEHPARTNNF